MTTKILSSDKARSQWRDTIDAAAAGENIVIERYGKPAVAIISYQDFLTLSEILEELRDAQDAQKILQEWREKPELARPWEEVKANLIVSGHLDE